MGVLQRLKEGISRIVKPKKANEQISYTSQATEKYQDDKGREVVATTTRVSDQPIKKPINQKLNEKMQRHDENTRSIIGRAKEAVRSEVAKIKGRKAQAEESGTGKAVKYLQSAPQKFVSKASETTAKIAEKTGKGQTIPIRSKGISQKQAIIAVRKDVAIIGNPLMTAFAGVPARTFEERGKRGKKTLYGSRISKKEEQKLKQKYGRNWRAYLRKDRRNRLYTTSDPITMAGVRREQKRTQMSTDFGSAFIPQGMGVALNKEHASVPFARRGDDPYDIDAHFMGGEHTITKRGGDPFNIDANFKGKLKL